MDFGNWFMHSSLETDKDDNIILYGDMASHTNRIGVLNNGFEFHCNESGVDACELSGIVTLDVCGQEITVQVENFPANKDFLMDDGVFSDSFKATLRDALMAVVEDFVDDNEISVCDEDVVINNGNATGEFHAMNNRDGDACYSGEFTYCEETDEVTFAFAMFPMSQELFTKCCRNAALSAIEQAASVSA